MRQSANASISFIPASPTSLTPWYYQINLIPFTSLELIKFIIRIALRQLYSIRTSNIASHLNTQPAIQVPYFVSSNNQIQIVNIFLFQQRQHLPRTRVQQSLRHHQVYSRFNYFTVFINQ